MPLAPLVLDVLLDAPAPVDAPPDAPAPPPPHVLEEEARICSLFCLLEDSARQQASLVSSYCFVACSFAPEESAGWYRSTAWTGRGAFRGANPCTSWNNLAKPRKSFAF